jgi:hypothetical protein
MTTDRGEENHGGDKSTLDDDEVRRYIDRSRAELLVEAMGTIQIDEALTRVGGRPYSKIIVFEQMSLGSAMRKAYIKGYIDDDLTLSLDRENDGIIFV